MYSGPVVWICAQFPTPYKFEGFDVSGKNEQLPTSSILTERDTRGEYDGGFIITRRVLDLLIDLCLEKGMDVNDVENRKRSCAVYFQSNVEDVAVTLRARFEESLTRRGVNVSGGIDCSTGGSLGRVTCETEVSAASYMKSYSSENHAMMTFPHDVFTNGHESENDKEKWRRSIVGNVDEVSELTNIPKRQKLWVSSGGNRADTSGSFHCFIVKHF